MRKFKKTLALILSVVMLLSIMAGCSKAKDEAAEAPADVADSGETAVADEGIHVTVGYQLAVQSMAPWIVTDLVYGAIAPMIYPTLGTVEEAGGPAENYIMKSIEKVGDLDYKIELWDNIYDSAGNHITASDVEFSYAGCQAQGDLAKAKYATKCEATGEFTLDFSISNNAPGTLQSALTVVYIVDKEAYEASEDGFASAPVGAGAYAVTEFVPGSHIVLERNPNFWCEDYSLLPKNIVPNADKITGRFITDATQLSIALEEGTIDFAASVTGIEAARFQNMEGYAVDTKPTNSCWTIFFNLLEGSVFADNLALRQAVCYAIDQDAVLAGGLNGHGSVVKALGSHNNSDYNPAWNDADYYNTNIEKAKELLAEAGYAPGELTLKLVGQWESSKAGCEVIQACLGQIGINVEIQCPDAALFSSYIEADSGAYDMIFMWYGASNGVAGLYNSALNLNTRTDDHLFNGLNDPKLQEMVEGVLSYESAPQAEVDAVHQYLTDQAYCYAIYLPNNYYAHVDTITDTVTWQVLSVAICACEFADNFVGCASK